MRVVRVISHLKVLVFYTTCNYAQRNAKGVLLCRVHNHSAFSESAAP
jgi:hypothetical protein